MGNIDTSMQIVSICIFIISIIVIVLTVVGSLMYLRKESSQKNTFLGKLFNFDYFMIEKVMHITYLFSVLCITGFSILIVILGISSGSADILLGGLFGGIILFIVAQFCNRMMFEWALLLVRQSNDTRSIRNLLMELPAIKESDAQVDAQGSLFETLPEDFQQKLNKAADGISNKTDDIASAAQAKRQARQANTWDCACGRKGNRGDFCPMCGSRRPS